MRGRRAIVSRLTLWPDIFVTDLRGERAPTYPPPLPFCTFVPSLLFFCIFSFSSGHDDTIILFVLLVCDHGLHIAGELMCESSSTTPTNAHTHTATHAQQDKRDEAFSLTD